MTRSCLFLLHTNLLKVLIGILVKVLSECQEYETVVKQTTILFTISLLFVALPATVSFAEALVICRNIFFRHFTWTFRHENPFFGISQQFREKQVPSHKFAIENHKFALYFTKKFVQSVFRHVRPISLECVQDRKKTFDVY